jgi:hypothetical protein
MKNLGRKIFIIFSFFATTIYASVVAEVTPKVVYSGEVATYKLTIHGEKVNKPIIDTLCGTNVISTSSQTSIQMINMDYKKSYILSYEFMPQKSCVIPAVSIDIDGKTEKSKAIKVEVKPPVQDKNANFLLSLTPSKQNIFVGEPFQLTLTLKQNKNAQAVDSKFVSPDFKGFWIKGKPTTVRSETAKYVITKVVYKLAAQRDGNLSIQPAQIKIATRINATDSWGSFLPQVKWRTYYSNTLHLHVKPLPNNAKLVGNFTIHAYADKLEINPSEPVNVTVEVDGEGDLEDMASFKPYINGVNVFAEKIEIHGNKLTQKFALVSDKDFTIPAFSIAFYNLKTQRVKKISTKPIYIKVKGAIKAKEDKLNIKRDTSTNESNLLQNNQTQQGVNTYISKVWVVVAFIIGVAFGIVLMFLKPLKWIKREKPIDMKDEKLLLVKLLPFKDKDMEVNKMVTLLEANLYAQTKQKIDKKVLKDILKKYDIS